MYSTCRPAACVGVRTETLEVSVVEIETQIVADVGGTWTCVEPCDFWEIREQRERDGEREVREKKAERRQEKERKREDREGERSERGRDGERERRQEATDPWCVAHSPPRGPAHWKP